MDELKATLTADGALIGAIHQRGGLCGTVFIAKASVEAARYTGSYTVTPKVTAQTLPTASRLMTDNLLVLGVPCYEVSNDSGTTVNIATEI